MAEQIQENEKELKKAKDVVCKLKGARYMAGAICAAGVAIVAGSISLNMYLNKRDPPSERYLQACNQYSQIYNNLENNTRKYNPLGFFENHRVHDTLKSHINELERLTSDPCEVKSWNARENKVKKRRYVTTVPVILGSLVLFFFGGMFLWEKADLENAKYHLKILENRLGAKNE